MGARKGSSLSPAACWLAEFGVGARLVKSVAGPKPGPAHTGGSCPCVSASTYGLDVLLGFSPGVSCLILYRSDELCHRCQASGSPSLCAGRNSPKPSGRSFLNSGGPSPRLAVEYPWVGLIGSFWEAFLIQNVFYSPCWGVVGPCLPCAWH